MLHVTRLLSATREADCAHQQSKPASRLGLRRLAHRMRRAVSLAAIALSLSLCGPIAAKADLVLVDVYFGDKDEKNDPDYVDYFIDDETREHWMGIMEKDGTYLLIKTGTKGNPTPDDPSGPKGDRESQIALAKQHGGGDVAGERDFWKTPLGEHVSSGGSGPGPVINPSDGDRVKGGTGNPSFGKEDLGEPQIIDNMGSLGSGKGGGFQFNAGSPGEQLKKPGGPGGNPGGNQGGGGSGDDDKGSHKPPPGSFYGPADLVDPLGPPIARSATKRTGKITVGALGGPDTKTGKGKSGETFLPYVEQKSLKKVSGKTKGSERGVIAVIKHGEKIGMGNGSKGQSSMTAPGILQTNAGFAASGPSANGATMGTRGHR